MVDNQKYTLKQLRGLRGLTQADLASKVNVSEQTISDYETLEGRLENAKYSTVLKIAEALEVEVTQIFLGNTWIKSKRNKQGA